MEALSNLFSGSKVSTRNQSRLESASPEPGARDRNKIDHIEGGKESSDDTDER